MKIGIVTSIKAPYRTLQIEEICKNKNIDICVYYTKKGKEDRDWEVRNSILFKEEYLDNINLFERFGTLNKGLRKIVKENEVIFIGGYEKPTYILLSLLCRIYKKKYVIIFDGISCNKLTQKENKAKWFLKSLVIKYSSAIWGNGTVSKRYFNEKFNYPINKIYNQYLTVDGEKIDQIRKNKIKVRKELRDRYDIKENEIILQYSGRLTEVKNVKLIIKALSRIKDKSIKLFITGGGKQEQELKLLAEKLGINLIITGFIDNQEELFKHYFISDIFVLASIYEPWGLVVNEAMYAELPALVSNICGCSLDLVQEGINGFTFNPYDYEDLALKINNVLEDKDKMSKESRNIINKYSFKNSSNMFHQILNNEIKVI